MFFTSTRPDTHIIVRATGPTERFKIWWGHPHMVVIICPRLNRAKVAVAAKRWLGRIPTVPLCSVGPGRAAPSSRATTTRGWKNFWSKMFRVRDPFWDTTDHFYFCYCPILAPFVKNNSTGTTWMVTGTLNLIVDICALGRQLC